MKKQVTKSFRPSLEALERREVPTARVIDAGPHIGDLEITGTAGHDSVDVVYVENLEVFRVVENGVITDFQRSAVTGGDVRFHGRAGNDYFRNLTSTFVLQTKANGGVGHDVLIGSSKADHLQGGKGSDYLDGNLGNDRLFGGRAATGADDDMNKLFGGLGDDELHGGDYALAGDMLYGEFGNDTLYGLAGNDSIYGGQDTDFLFGMDGDDRIDSGLDWAWNYVEGGSGNDTLYGGYGMDYLHGNAGDDELYGFYGNDALYGGDDHDRLFGGHGDDYLDGERGIDHLWGNSTTIPDEGGADAFVEGWDLDGNVDVYHDFNPDEGDYEVY